VVSPLVLRYRMVMMKRSLQSASQRSELAGLQDLARLVQRTDGFHPLVGALKDLRRFGGKGVVR
jgi:hypothetical protein